MDETYIKVKTAGRTLASHEAMAMVRKEQVHNLGGRDMKLQATFIAGLFGGSCLKQTNSIAANSAMQGLQQNPTRATCVARW